MARRYYFLIFTSVLIGVVSSCLLGPVVIARGVILSICLTIGSIIINTVNANHLSQNQAPKMITSIVIGSICGLVAGFIMNYLNLMESFYNITFSFMPTHINGDGYKVVTIATCFLYGLLFHGAYAMRWISNEKQVVKAILLVSAICGLFRMITENLLYPDFPFRELSSFENITSLCYRTIFSLLLTSIPFTYMWFSLHFRLDPAWTFERWQSIVKSEH